MNAMTNIAKTISLAAGTFAITTVAAVALAAPASAFEGDKPGDGEVPVDNPYVHKCVISGAPGGWDITTTCIHNPNLPDNHAEPAPSPVKTIKLSVRSR